MTATTDLLQDCLEAFEAVQTAPKARKLLKKWGLTPGAYAGTGSYILTDYMAKKLREHLDEAKQDQRISQFVETGK